MLIGNLGDGYINAFGPRSGEFLGTLRDPRGQRIHVDGLWGMQFGNGILQQPTNALFVAAGPGDEEHGTCSSDSRAAVRGALSPFRPRARQ